MARPIGVTILAVLSILAGIVFLIFGSLGLIFGSLGLLAEVPELTSEEVQLLQAVGALGVVLGIVYLVSGAGLLRLAVWGWWLAIIVNIGGIISSIVQVVINPADIVGSIIGLVLALIILSYLYVVRGAFGMGS